MSKSALPALQQALRRSFQSLESNQRAWRVALAECGPLMGSLGNLAEQLRALSNVQIPDTPLGGFPDLEERLRFKLQQSVDTVLGKLDEKMASLQAVRDAVGNQVSAVVQLYEQNPDLPAAVERSPTAPSLADMLEWLQDAERHYRRQYLRRKALLQTLGSGDLALLESAPQRWRSLESPDADDHITDALCKVSLLVESG